MKWYSWAEGSTDYHHHGCNHHCEDRLELDAGGTRCGQIGLILARQLVLGVESCGISNGAQNLFGNGTSESIGFEGIFVVLDDETRSKAHGQHDGNDRGHQNQRQLPRIDKSDDESCHEGGKGRHGQRDLLGDAILNQIGIGGNSCGHLSSTKLIEKGDILAQNGSQIVFSNLLGNMLSCIEKGRGANVNGDEFANGQVDEIERESSQGRLEFVRGDGALKDAGEISSQLSKNDLTNVSTTLPQISLLTVISGCSAPPMIAQKDPMAMMIKSFLVAYR